MIIKEYLKPESIDEAYNMLQKKGAIILGGGAFLHLQRIEAEAAVDLSKLGLSFIEEKGDSIEIGAYTTLREIEESELLKGYFNGILSKVTGLVMGVQVRNTATIGGTVYGKYGFSDIITALSVLDAEVELYKEGRIPFETFLSNKIEKDILTKIILKKDDRKAVFNNIRNSSMDFSILNTAVSNSCGKFKISVGARPQGTVLAYDAMEYLEKNGLNEENAEKAVAIASESLSFGSDIRASSWYRKELCKVLVKRGILEVI